MERQNGVPQLVFLSTLEERDAEAEDGERSNESAGPSSLAEWIQLVGMLTIEDVGHASLLREQPTRK